MAKKKRPFDDIRNEHEIHLDPLGFDPNDIKTGGDLDDRIGQTLLEAARRGHHVKVAEIIAKDKRYLNYRDPKSRATPLHIAASVGAKSVVEEILQHEETHLLLRDVRDRLASEIAFLVAEDYALADLIADKEVTYGERMNIKVTRRHQET